MWMPSRTSPFMFGDERVGLLHEVEGPLPRIAVTLEGGGRSRYARHSRDDHSLPLNESAPGKLRFESGLHPVIRRFSFDSIPLRVGTIQSAINAPNARAPAPGRCRRPAACR